MKFFLHEYTGITIFKEDLFMTPVPAVSSKTTTNSVTKPAAGKKTETITIPIGKTPAQEDAIINEVQRITKIQENITKDLTSGVLTKQEGFGLFGTKITDDYFNFDSEKYSKLAGKELTLGEIKYRYGLPVGTLKEANPKLFIGTITQEGGLTLDGYTPTYAGQSNIKIPAKDIKKYVDTKY